MKSKILAILFFMSFPLLAWSQANIIMNAAMEKDLNESVENIVKESLDEEDRDEGVEPTVAGMRPMFFDLVYDLYLNGYVSTQGFEQFKADYNQLEDIVIPEGGLTKMIQEQKLIAMFKTFFAGQFAKFKASPQKCTTYLGVSNHGQCCQGLVAGAHASYKFPAGNLKKDYDSCSAHSQCFSGVCEGIEEGETAGSCEPIRTCFQPVPTNSVCGADNPICKDESAACIEVNFNSSNTNSCAYNGNSCENNTQCCSDSCVSGKCVESQKCLICKRKGEKPKNNEMCCPGLYKGLEGKCIQDWPPFIIPQSNATKTKVWDKISNVVSELFGISKVYADENAGQCTAPCNHVSHLPDQQKKEIEKAQKECIQASESQDKINECLQGVQAQERQFYSEHKSKKTIKESKSTKSQKEYVSEYNIPHVTARGLSDARECRFNSLKDDWSDASNLEKNAEVTLRAFEYIYSGRGDDWWTEKGKSKNLFYRFGDVAKNLRKNRYDYIQSLKENDIKMTCLCIASFGGVSKFPDRAQFFADTCEKNSDIQDEIAALNILDNGDSGTGSNDSYSNHLDNVTQGATGIKHEQFLVNWLDKRKNIQIERFIANTELETELQDTINYLRTEPWDNPENNKADSKKLYNYAVKWTAGWVKFVLVVIAIVAAVVVTFLTAGTAGVAIAGIMITAKTAAVVAGVALIGVSVGLLRNPDLAPKHADKRYINNRCWNGLCTAKYDAYERYLAFTKSNICGINYPTSFCLKNAYLRAHFYDKASQEQKAVHYLIDIPSPLFVDSSQIKYSNDFAGPEASSLLNKRWNSAMPLFESTRPTKYKSKRSIHYVRKSEKFKDKDLMNEFFYNEQTRKVSQRKSKSTPDPLFMALVPPTTFTLPSFNDKMKTTFVEGVKKYATCYGLKACGGQNAKGTEDFSEQDIGFKLFFENPDTGTHNEEEVTAFAEYVYQLHFLWPNTSEENSLSYPLPGMVPYFEAVLYNVKLLGSLRADRGNRYNDAFTAYEQDLEKRMKDYAVTPGSMGLGEKSRNAKFGKKFMATFQKIDLKGGVGVAALQSEIAGSLKSNEYNAAEARALQAGLSKAMRAADDKKRADHYANTQGKTERGQNNTEKAKEFLNSFNSPINRFPSNSAGSRFAGAQNNNLADSLSDSLKNSQTAKVATGAGVNAAMGANSWGQDSSTPSWTNTSYGSGSDSAQSAGAASTKTGDQLNSDISNTDVEHMLLSLNKDKSSFEENPDDTLFIKVSKAYRRNLARVLVRKTDLAQNTQSVKETKKRVHSDISEDEKSQLKELLNKN